MGEDEYCRGVKEAELSRNCPETGCSHRGLSTVPAPILNALRRCRPCINVTADNSIMAATLFRKELVKGSLSSNMEKLETLDNVGGSLRQCNLVIPCWL